MQRTLAGVDANINVLEVDSVSELRLGWNSRFTAEEIRQHLRRHPDISVYHRKTGEFVLGGPWRHRDDIATIVELSANSNALPLLDGWTQANAAAGMVVVVASEQAERRKREFYASAGFAVADEIYIYELARVRASAPRLNGLRFTSFDAGSPDLDQLLDLDHSAFAWLWWNSSAEFDDYLRTPGVRVALGWDGDQLVSYYGTTQLRNWGHLDRIAVAPGYQGRGFGRATLDHAVMSLAANGSKRVGLSTQARNDGSRRLYEAYGFRRHPHQDYRVYARRIDGGSIEELTRMVT